MFIYQIGVDFFVEFNEIVFNAAALVSFMQIRLQNQIKNKCIAQNDRTHNNTVEQ